jgi:hypothetical protein
MPWIPIAAAAISAIGSGVAANATKNAQNKANDTAAKQAADAQAAQWNQYLLSRGINPGMLGVPGAAGSAVNTILPLGANINGIPAEQLILQNLFGRSGLVPAAPEEFTSDANIEAFLQANPDVLQQITDNMAGSDDTRSPAQWLKDHVSQTEAQAGGGTFTDSLKNFAQQAAQQAATGGAGNIPQGVTDANAAALASINKVYNGGFLEDELNALKGITDARTALANTGYARNAELRGGIDDVLKTRLGAAQDILGTQLGGLDAVLGSRRGAANDILGTELSALANLRGVGEAGAQGIYGAELTGADTYENAVKQAVSRSLEQNKASRALRGFSGDSSGDALLRARTLAGGYQQAGGARAQAGINLQKLLSDVRRQEAAGQLTSRSKSATSLGDASVQDALARLAANTGFATTKGSANELASLGRAGILDSDVERAIAGANLQNAGDNATLIGSNITRQLGSTGLANSLFGQQLNLQNQAAGAKYADINALLGPLGFLRQQQPATPGVIQPNIQPTINSGQIFGSGLSAVGSSLSNYFNNKSLIDALNKGNGQGNVDVAELYKTGTPAS